MRIVIAEHVDDVVHSVEASLAAMLVVLAPEDAGRAFGYARVRVAGPEARHEGVAVVLGDVDGAPDPILLRVREAKAKGKGTARATAEVRRRALPVICTVDRETGAVVVERLPPAAP